MTINECIASALKQYAGKTLNRAMINAVVINKFPHLAGKETSFNLSDHVFSPKQASQYADYNLAAASNGYTVLPVSDWKMKPATAGRGSKGATMSHAEALAAANALLQGSTSATKTVVIVPVAKPTNGEVKAQA